MANRENITAAAESTTLTEILNVFQSWFPPELAEDWDNTGLLLGDAAARVGAIVTCLTLTPDVVEEAIDAAADLIVTHHPIFFHPIKSLTAGGQNGHLFKLARAEIAVYSPHTSYDNAISGINEQLANRLGLDKTQPLVEKRFSDVAPASSDAPSGAGRVGKLAAMHSTEQLARKLATSLGISEVQVVGDLRKPCRTVGIVCGAGASMLGDAVDARCDVLILGEARFHDYLAARQSNVALILLGHYESERFALETLAQRCAEEWPNLRCWASRAEHNPIGRIQIGS